MFKSTMRDGRNNHAWWSCERPCPVQCWAVGLLLFNIE